MSIFALLLNLIISISLPLPIFMYIKDTEGNVNITTNASSIVVYLVSDIWSCDHSALFKMANGLRTLYLCSYVFHMRFRYFGSCVLCCFWSVFHNNSFKYVNNTLILPNAASQIQPLDKGKTDENALSKIGVDKKTREWK